MSILSKIVSSIFGHASAAPAGTPSAPAAPGAAPAGTSSAAAGAAPTVDVEAILTKLAASNKEKLDWQKSIVDLMKLLNLNSSLTARKELADELHFTGDKNDFSDNEYLAAQTSHAKARRERRQGSRLAVAKIRDKLPGAGRRPLVQRTGFD